GHRADPLPLAGRGVVPPHVALAPVVRPARVARGDEQVAVDGVEHALVRDVAGRLPRDPLPGDAAVGGPVDRVLLVGHAHLDGLGGVAGGAGPLVERHPDHALDVTVVLAVPGPVVPRVGEAGHLGPGGAVVGALPQPVAAGRAEVEDAVLVGVDREALAHAPPGHVAAELERQRARLPGLAAVGG